MSHRQLGLTRGKGITKNFAADKVSVSNSITTGNILNVGDCVVINGRFTGIRTNDGTQPTRALASISDLSNRDGEKWKLDITVTAASDNHFSQRKFLVVKPKAADNWIVKKSLPSDIDNLAQLAQDSTQPLGNAFAAGIFTGQEFSDPTSLTTLDIIDQEDDNRINIVYDGAGVASDDGEFDFVVNAVWQPIFQGTGIGDGQLVPRLE